MKGSEAVDYPIVLYPCRVVPVVEPLEFNRKASLKLLEKEEKPVKARDVLDEIIDSKWYRVEEIQALCQVSRKTVYRWIGLSLRSKKHGAVYLKARKCFARRRWFVLGQNLKKFLWNTRDRN